MEPTSEIQINTRYEIKIPTETLANYLLGLELEPKNYQRILAKLKEDQGIIRTKYGLPHRKMLLNHPGEYERSLREIAKKLGVTILSRVECGNFFENNTLAGACFFPTTETGSLYDKIGVDIKKDDLKTYIGSLMALEHELIHALQSRRYPQMPIELQEYEAYVAGLNLSYLQENPDSIRDIFDFFIGGSVRNWYRRENAIRQQSGNRPLIPKYLSQSAVGEHNDK